MQKKIEVTDIEYQMRETAGSHNDQLLKAWDNFYDKQVEDVGVFAKQLLDGLRESGKKDAEEARTLYERQVKDWEARAKKDAEEACSLYENHVKDLQTRANKMANDFIEYSRQNIDKARKFAREQDSELSKLRNLESR